MTARTMWVWCSRAGFATLDASRETAGGLAQILYGTLSSNLKPPPNEDMSDPDYHSSGISSLRTSRSTITRNVHYGKY